MNFCHRFQNSCPKCEGSGKVLDSVRVGAFLKEKRVSISNSLREIAGRMGISAAYLSDLEHGRRAWTFEKIERFENSLLKTIKDNGRKISVYGLFNDDGKCEYVGATAHVDSRRITHRSKWKHLKFRVLQIHPVTIVDKVESDLIKTYKEKGECQLNKRIHRTHSSSWTY